MSPRRPVLLGLLAAAALVAGGCGSSPEDDARDDGKAVGEAIYTLRTTASAEERASALDTIRKRTASVRDELGPAIRSQLDDIGAQLRTAVQNRDPAAVRTAVLDARAELDAISSDTDSVVNEFRRGVREGYEDAAG